MNSNLTGQIILQAVLIAMNAIFACAEIAVISMSGNRLDKLAGDGDKRALRLARLTNQPARFLATIQVAITLSGFLGSAFAADNFSDMLVNAIMKLNLPVSEKTLDTISVVLITIILSFFTLVFGELVPKRLAMRKSESIALAISGLVSMISKLFAPIVWLLTASTNSILRLLGIDPNAEDEEITEDEIRMMANAGSEKGVIDHEENEIIQNLFEFDDMHADEIATHRTELDVLWTKDDIDKWHETITASEHSYYPICDKTIDNIIGLLDARKYFILKNPTKDIIMEKAVVKAYAVPESIRADILLQNMKKSHNYFAVVTDEFGGTYGVMPELFLKMDELVKEGRMEEAMKVQYAANDIIYKMCSSHANMYAVAKEILRVNEKLDIGGVRLPLENLQEADKAIAKEAAVMVKEAKEKYL